MSVRLRHHADTPHFQFASFQEGFVEKVRGARDARQVLGANLALVPTLEQSPDLLRARLDLIDTARERVIATRTIQESASRPFEFLDRTYRESAAMLGLVPRVATAPEDLGVRGAGTLRFYLQGSGRIRAGESLEERRRAVEDLELACRTEPEAVAPRAALAVACLRMQDLTQDRAWLTRAGDRRARGRRARATRDRSPTVRSRSCSRA